MLDIDAKLVRILLQEQCQDWSEDKVMAIASTGTDNALFRLGSNRLIRLPAVEWAYEQPIKEHALMPMLDELPLQIPTPLFLGKPGATFPAHWTVVTWIDGSAANPEDVGDWPSMTMQLADFLHALWQNPVPDKPPMSADVKRRGGDLRCRDRAVGKSLQILGTEIDARLIAAYWRDALNASPRIVAEKWVHGDLHGGNLITLDNKLVGVIDWGMMGVGDPAVDLMVAWTWMPENARTLLKERLGCDDAMWARAKGWALSVAVIALAHYRGKHEGTERIAYRTINAIANEA